MQKTRVEMAAMKRDAEHYSRQVTSLIDPTFCLVDDVSRPWFFVCQLELIEAWKTMGVIVLVSMHFNLDIDASKFCKDI